MKLRGWVIAGCFLLLAVHYNKASPLPEPTGQETGVWRGAVSTVTARGAMLSGLWVSSPELATNVERGDSLIVLGYRRGMYITPWCIRMKPARGFFHRARRALLNRFTRFIPDSLALGISTAVILGARGRVPIFAARAFQLSGTAHLLALSGMHTGMVAGFILLLSRLLFGKRLIGAISAVAAIAVFVALTGGRASTIRAGIMAGTVILWAALRGGRVHPLSVWCVALLPAALDRSLLSDAGAQMSYGAVLSLILLARSWNGLVGRFLTPLWAGVVVITALAPISVSVYGGVNPAGAVSTVLSVPLMTAVMALGVLAAAGAGSGLLAWLCERWLWILGFFTGFTVEVTPDTSLVLVWLALVGVLFVVKRVRNYEKRFR
ncbi:MAG: ComEC/Rec2 family competence protein [Candidatus Fermentibacteraceae bacterium]